MTDRQFLLCVAAWLAMCIVIANIPPLWLLIPSALIWIGLALVLWFAAREGA